MAAVPSSYKASVEIQYRQSLETITTFHPNKVNDFIRLNQKFEPAATIKIRLEDKETLEYIKPDQVLLVLRGDVRHSYQFTRQGLIYVYELVIMNLSVGSQSITFRIL